MPSTLQLKLIESVVSSADKQTVAPPPVPHPPEDELLELELELLEDELEEELLELLLELELLLLDEPLEVLEEPFEGIEHSLALFAGFGSVPKVATLQTNEPLMTLKVNLPEAPKATLVGFETEQVWSVLHMVVYPLGRFVAASALDAAPNNATARRIRRNMKESSKFMLLLLVVIQAATAARGANIT